jgi:hypothetical protein
MKTRLYHYVPPCPRCGSLRTGRFITGSYDSISEVRALKKGELIQSKYTQDSFTCFCDDCGISFPGQIKIMLLSSAELQEQKKLRCITEDLESGLQDYYKDDQKYQKDLLKQNDFWHKHVLRRFKKNANRDNTK